MKKEAADAKKKKVYRCVACEKDFSSENAFKQHCDSVKHANRVQQIQEEKAEMNKFSQICQK